MTYLTLKPNQKNSEIIGISLWPTPSPKLNPIDYAIWGVLENKTNATFCPNISSLTTAVLENWNKIFEEFILKACKLFRKRLDTIFEKNVDHIK